MDGWGSHTSVTFGNKADFLHYDVVFDSGAHAALQAEAAHQGVRALRDWRNSQSVGSHT